MNHLSLHYYIFLTIIIINVFLNPLESIYADEQVSPIIIEQNREQQRILDTQANKRLEARPPGVTPNIEIATPTLLDEGQCQVVKQFFPYGADKIPNSEINSIFNPLLNQCIDNIKIATIANQIQSWYLLSGFITTRVSIKQPQNSFKEKGNLEIWVVEGKIGNFILGQNTQFDISRIKGAFPVKTGDVLNIHDLDQGLEQLNTLFSQKFKMQIKPSQRPGYSDIILLESNTSQTSLNLLKMDDSIERQKVVFNYSNGGVKSTGEDLYNLKYTKENAFGYNDTLSFSLQRALPETTSKNESIRFNASVPFGYWNYSINYNLGDTVRAINGNTTSFLSKSKIQTTQLSASRILSRSQKSKLESSASLEFSERKSFINDTLITTSSRQISSFDLGLTYTRYFPGSTLILSPTISSGTSLFGGVSNAANITKDQPHAEYNLFKLYSYYRQQYLSASRYQFSIQNSFNLQYSDTALYGEKQFILGGEYSIRGYKENVMSSDSGMSLKNDIILPIGSWIYPWNNNELILPLSVKVFLDIGEGYPFVDGKRKSISGWGYSVDYNYRWFTASLTRAKSINSPDIFVTDEGWVNYLNFSAQLTF